MSTHAELIETSAASPIKILVQTAGYTEKVTFDMQSTDLLAKLRAEIQAWWEVKLNQLKMQLQQQDKDGSGGAAAASAAAAHHLVHILTSSAAAAAASDQGTPNLRLISQVRIIFKGHFHLVAWTGFDR